MCLAGLLALGAYTAFEPTESSAAPDPSTTTTSTPAPTTTLRDRADGLPFTVPDPSWFPTFVGIPETVGAGEPFEVTITCPDDRGPANLGAFAVADPNPVDLTFPVGFDLHLGPGSPEPDADGAFRLRPVAPTETGTYFLRTACTDGESWRSDALEFFSDGSSYSQYTHTPPELMHRIEVVPPTPPPGVLPECL